MSTATITSEEMAADIIGNVEEVATTLSMNRVQLRVWITKAMAFYKMGKYGDFVTLLESAITRCNDNYADYKEDLVRTYNILTGHLVRQAYQETANRRHIHLAKVTNLFYVVGKITQTNIDYLLCRGYALMLTAGRAHEADSYFIAVLRHRHSNVPALIGRGCLAYNRKDYYSALGYFKNALRYNPRGPGDVRIGIAHCFLKLNDKSRALRFFELALGNNGRCVNALVGIAMMKMNIRQPEQVRDGLNLLCAAYEINKKHPLVMLYLANHFYFRGEYKKLQVLAAKACDFSDDKDIKARCYQVIARSHHAVKAFDQALIYYQKAAHVGAQNYVLPLMGLGQMYIHFGNFVKAEESLEGFLAIYPNNVECNRLLGTMYRDKLRPGQLDKAVKLFLKVLKLQPTDYETWISLAIVYEHQSDWINALEALSNAIKVYKAPDGSNTIPIEWLNNIAVVQMYAKQHSKALETLNFALERFGNISSQVAGATKLTLRFNLARVYEDMFDYATAEAKYKSIIHDYPNYIDCYLRLGIMAFSLNQTVAATEYYKEALKVDRNSLEARTFLGNHYIKQGHIVLAMHNFNAILANPVNKNDSLALIAIGNVFLRNVYKTLNTEEKSKGYQEKALDIFGRVLEKEPRNIWAANGIAISLCAMERFEEAKTIFKQIIDSTKDCLVVTQNLAHATLELGQFAQASQMYKHCLEHSQQRNNVELMKHLACALFQDNRWERTRIVLLKALRMVPYDHVLMYNLALTIVTNCYAVVHKKRPLMEEVSNCGSKLRLAQKFFTYLSKSDVQKNQYAFLAHAAQGRVRQCEKLLLNVPNYERRVHDMEYLDAARIRVQTQRFRETQNRMDESRRQRLDEEQMLLEERDAKRQELLERTKEFINFIPPEMGKKKRGRASGKKIIEELGSDNNDSPNKAAKKVRKRKNTGSEKKPKTQKTADLGKKKNRKGSSKVNVTESDTENDSSGQSKPVKKKRTKKLADNQKTNKKNSGSTKKIQKDKSADNQDDESIRSELIIKRKRSGRQMKIPEEKSSDNEDTENVASNQKNRKRIQEDESADNPNDDSGRNKNIPGEISSDNQDVESVSDKDIRNDSSGSSENN